ncbi:glycoside hydrolase family 97 protein [Chondrinema litorale]|uniref:glycoside hydrolase family 97 protein n=1 Tax=Chondrinema litorale TaxID=2994555 RepID=UPI002542BBD2|nr:glycoside hydrolase family 97 protein [Chondrinema litorale]UZR94064.1 glycoside hydrolase family 97 protein [Chondrinema litorale]
MKINVLTLLFILSTFISLKAQKTKTFTLVSPDEGLIAQIDVSDKIYYSLQVKEQEIILPSAISMTLEDGTVLGKKAKVKDNFIETYNTFIDPLYWKKDSINDHYNYLLLDFKQDFSLEFRIYDEGFAYRFITKFDDPITIKSEEINFNFRDNYPLVSAQLDKDSFQHSYENNYITSPIQQLSNDKMMMLPFLAEARSGVKMVFTEADLESYPGLYIVKGEEKNSLKSILPKYPTKEKIGGHMDFDLLVEERADYLAKTEGSRSFPWRVFVFSEDDRTLLNNDLVYKLAKPSEGDFSWVKPGKVAWDWWNALNLTGVDFEPGFNTETYKYFVDFAAKNNIEYINLDEGWSDQFDLTKITTEIDMPELIAYAKQKDVKIILWCVARTLDAQLEEAMNQFEKWGISGIKVDFMDRDDQKMVDFYYRIAKAAAEKKILVNFHGAYKPTGLNRTFPNVINQEAVRGLEYNKFSEPDGTTPDHAATIPFIRMLAGPMDYTPGAMNNVNKDNFKVVFDAPMSQGTRAQQIAMYVVYEGPLQMLSDAPTAYEKEPKVLDIIADIPTTWDDTQAIGGKVGEFAIIARKKGDAWYVGGITNWEARKVAVNFFFLTENSYDATILSDMDDSKTDGTKYQITKDEIKPFDRRELQLAPGGGFFIKLTPKAN